MELKDFIKSYKTPLAKVLEVRIQGIICQSPGTGAVTIEDYTEEKLDW